MRYSEIALARIKAPTAPALREAVEEVEILGQKLLLHRNPTPPQLAALVRRYERVRGIEHEGNVWLWNGYVAAHFQVISALGISQDAPGEFQLRYESESEPHHYVVWIHRRRDETFASANFQSMFGKLDWRAP